MSDTLSLRLANDAEKRARDEITYAAWGERLTLPQYLAREVSLRSHPWSQAGMETWLLCDDGAIVSSCESLAMASRQGDVDGTSYGIASVYTEEKYRGRRYATTLVDRVSATLLGRAGSQAVALYSDVGVAIYGRAGFVYPPRDDWWIAAQPSALPPGLVVDNQVAVGAVRRLASNALAIVPTPTQLDWHHARERYYSAARNRRPPARHRLALGDDQIVIAADLKNTELLVLSLSIAAGHGEALLRAAADLAWQLGLGGVRLWAPDDLAPFAGVVAKPLVDTSLPMIRAAAGAETKWCDVQRGVWV